MSKVQIGLCKIVTAFDSKTIGSKVTDTGLFFQIVKDAVATFDFDSCRVPGQAIIRLPELANKLVMPGTGRRTLNTNDYVIRSYRGRVGLFLQREKAVKESDSVSVVIYTKKAYINDPDTQEDSSELVKFTAGTDTHVLVAVLGSVGDFSPMPLGTFVRNLGGANNEALKWSADEIRSKAKVISEYNKNWITVAD